MLPPRHRLHRSRDFDATVREGVRVRRGGVVVHLRTRPVTEDRGWSEGPRFGLIVSKAVGNAVHRHRVSRRLRHVCADLLAIVPADRDIAVRALPGSAELGSQRLAGDVASAIRKAEQRIVRSRVAVSAAPAGGDAR